MKELKFKTTLSCAGCQAKVAPGLDAIEEIEKWEVDLASEDKIITVTANAEIEDKIKAVFEEKGFVAERIG